MSTKLCSATRWATRYSSFPTLLKLMTNIVIMYYLVMLLLLSMNSLKIDNPEGKSQKCITDSRFSCLWSKLHHPRPLPSPSPRPPGRPPPRRALAQSPSWTSWRGWPRTCPRGPWVWRVFNSSISYHDLCLGIKVATYRHAYRAEPKEPTQFGYVSGSELQNLPFSHSGIVSLHRSNQKNQPNLVLYLVRRSKIFVLIHATLSNLFWTSL